MARITLAGRGASPGTFTGPVVYIEKPAMLKKRLTPGSVLFVNHTSPEWMEAFDMLADGKGAIVTAVGGRLCHAAITSREYGIPCVVGVGGFTEHILSHRPAQATVDGSTGIVEVELC